MSARSAPEEYEKALSMKGASDQVWILKVPKFLMKHLQEQGAGGRDVGTVQLKDEVKGSNSSRPSGPPSVGPSYTLKLSEAGLSEGIPREYDVRFQSPPPATYLISRGKGEADAAPAHEGRVERRGEMRPTELNGAYRSLLKGRVADADQPKRQVQVYDDAKPKLNHRQTQRDEKALLHKRQAQREEKDARKRAKPDLSFSELKSKLLELFVQRDHWSRRDLEQALGNRDTLGKVLDEICDRNTKKGPRYNDWELKPAFRTGLPGSSGAGS